MSQQPPGGSPPQWSADRQWWWDGQKWVPAAQASPPPAPQMTPAFATAGAPAPRRSHLGRNLAIGCGGLIALFIVIAIIGSLATQSNSAKPTASTTSSNGTTAVTKTTSTPTPLSTATVTASTPTPTAKPKPTATPTPKPTQAPAPAGPAPIVLNGTGQQALHFTVTQGLSIFTAKCGCSGNFVLELDDSSGHMQDIPINVIGRYSGSVGEGLQAGGYIAKVDADASWTITITQPRSPNGAPLPQSYTKSGQQIVGPFSAGDAIGIAAYNDGDSNFVVAVLDQDGQEVDIPINEIGHYSGSTISNDLSNGPFYLNVDSNGNWSVTVSAP